MKRQVFYFLLLGIILVPPNLMAQSSISVYSNKDFPSLKVNDDPLEVVFVEHTLNKKSLEWLSRAEFRGRISSVVFDHCDLSTSVFQEFSDLFKQGQLKKLSFYGIKSTMSPKFDHFADQLEILTIVDCGFGKAFYKNFTQENTKQLKELTISNSLIWKEYVEIIRSWKIGPHIQSLDLSDNSLSNEILTILCDEEMPELKIVKLNGLDLVISDNPKKYSKQFPALISSFNLNFNVPWERMPKLKHLEMSFIAEVSESLIKVYDEARWENFDVFIGPLPKEEIITKPLSSMAYDQKKYQNKIDIYDKTYQHIFSRPIKSRYMSVSFNSAKRLDFFLHSPQAQYTSNLILAGLFWGEIDIQAVLDMNLLPSLKTVELKNASLTQSEAMNLIRRYPQYEFNIDISSGLRNDGIQYWPIIIQD
ncbi:hypothetical protein JNM05_00460 [bacterium]|nr:hypothetical protein [bacterium]